MRDQREGAKKGEHRPLRDGLVGFEEGTRRDEQARRSVRTIQESGAQNCVGCDHVSSKHRTDGERIYIFRAPHRDGALQLLLISVIYPGLNAPITSTFKHIRPSLESSPKDNTPAQKRTKALVVRTLLVLPTYSSFDT